MRRRAFFPVAVAVSVALAAVQIAIFGGTAHAATATLGNTTVGAQLDSGDANYLNGSRFTTGSTAGTLSSISAYVGTVDASPNNQFQVAVYTDASNKPGALVASSASGTLVANSWNTISLSGNLAANTAYWLIYNTNASTSSLNNLRYDNGGTGGYSTSRVTFGTWPSTFGSSAVGSVNYSIYATYTTAGPSPSPSVSASPSPSPTPTPTPTGPPTGGAANSVLLVTTASNPFTTYYAEILKAEGLNYYQTADISQVNQTTLAGYDLVLLGEMPLTDAQVSMFSTWVNGGGKLIAMRPDKKLASLLGLSDAASTLADSYLKINNSSGPGFGIVGQTIQYHGTADRYNIAGATPIATLYSSSTAATTSPAVTTRAVGTVGGQAASFTYDLARSVVLTRQGNVAWSGQQRDGVDGYEASEMFQGAFSGQPDWNNLDQAQIPIADEQQRLLANMIQTMEADRKPLPRFWYYPRDVKAVVIMTGDDHGHDGTAGRFDHYLAISKPGCVVANWECIRSSSYMYTDTPMTNAQAVSYTQQGFELGLHVSTNCLPWGTAANLDNDYNTQLAAFRTKYSGIPNEDSIRTHCVEWDDWDTQPKTKLKYGIRLDTDYYYYPTSFVLNRPGFFNGTGEIMRFGQQDGTPIDVYQATTDMTDESGMDFPMTATTLLDNAVGAPGYYAALTANMHTDTADSFGSDAIIAAAQARGVPVVSGRQMLTWLDARNSSSFKSITWNGSSLSFSVTGGANQLRGMVPFNSGAGTLATLKTSGGATVPYVLQTVKGITYAFFTAAVGGYVATYSSAPDTTAPTVVNTTPPNGATDVSTTAPLTVTFSKPMDPASINTSTVVLQTSAGAGVAATVTYAAGSTSATVVPGAALAAGTGYKLTVKSGSAGVRDVSGNPLAADVVTSFTTDTAAATVIGYNSVGSTLDSGDQNWMNGTKFVTGSTSFTVSKMSVYLKSVQAAPNNQFQLAIYADNNGSPGALVASTSQGTGIANSWNTVPLSVTLAANTAYWFMFNTNGANNLSYDTGSTNQGAYSSSGRTFGTWPATFGSSILNTAKFSIYVS